jgi:antitoxin VapB
VNEISRKLALVRQLLAARQLDALLVKRIGNFAWLTDGAASYVSAAADQGAAQLLITADAGHIITNTIEAPRLEAEERLLETGFKMAAAPWYGLNPALETLAAGLRLAADAPHAGAADLSDDLLRLRLALTPAEGERFRALGRLCADAMHAAIRQVRPGLTEYQIAGLLGAEAQARGAQPIVNLIATDERIFCFRHPLPTGKVLDRYAMLVLCGRRQGLVCSITRLVHFGPIPAEVQRKAIACAAVDATLIAQTRPGARLGDVFTAATAAYAAAGFADEWKLHHQGGPAGYQPRELVATPDSTHVTQAGEAYAWNPSITGVKSEDTILVGAEDNVVLTEIAGWPALRVEAAGQVWARPAILQV